MYGVSCDESRDTVSCNVGCKATNVWVKMDIKLELDSSCKNTIMDLYKRFYYVNYFYKVPSVDVNSLSEQKIMRHILLDVVRCIEQLFDKLGEMKIYNYAKWYTSKCNRGYCYRYGSSSDSRHLKNYNKYITYETCNVILANKLYKDEREKPAFEKIEFKKPR